MLTNDTLVWANAFRTNAGLVIPLSWQGFFSLELLPACNQTFTPGSNREGGDLYNVQLPPDASAGDCASLCCSVPACAAYVYADGAYGTASGNCQPSQGPCCWLKSIATPLSTAGSNVGSGVLTPRPIPAAVQVQIAAALVPPGTTTVDVVHFGGASIPVPLLPPEASPAGEAGEGEGYWVAPSVPMVRGGAVLLLKS